MAKTQPNIDDIKGLTQWINFLWLKLKDLFSAESETTNDNYLPKIDDVNKKLVKSNINDDGTTPKYGANTIWHSGNDGSTSGLDADLLDGNHASDFATSAHNHDATYLKLTGGTLSGGVNPSTDNNVILGSPYLRYKVIYASLFVGNASTADKLKTSRKINGVSFDGTADITIPGSPETVQLLLAGGEILNYLTDGIYRLNSTLPTGNYPDSVCGTKVDLVLPTGTEILRQYTGNNGNHDVKTQIMLIQNETYRRSGLGNYWNEWVRLITCRDMANYATIDMLETSDGGQLDPYNPIDVYRDTTYHIYGDAKEGKYNINLMPLFTSPPLEIIEIDIVIAPKSSGEYTLEIHLSDYDIDTRESSSSTTVNFGDYASITIPQLTSFVLLKIYMFSNVQRCLIVYTFG